MKKITLIIIVLLALFSHPPRCHAVDCDMDRGPCIAAAGGAEVTLDITPRPVKSMKELLFVATVKGAKMGPSLLLELSMPGMYMGRIEVILKKGPDGSFSGRGIIPRCPSGRKLWQADMPVPGRGKVTYRFHVDH